MLMLTLMMPSSSSSFRRPLYFSTFSSYLSHKASTVRQATSSVFKYIVAKDGSNPTMLKLVLQGLAANWCVADIAGKPDAAADGQSWEWKEGRMLAYVILMTHPLFYFFCQSRHFLWRSAHLISDLFGSAASYLFYADVRKFRCLIAFLRYELILKFVLTNHVHYLFPTSLVGKARAIAGKANRASAHATRRLSLDRALLVGVDHIGGGGGSGGGRGVGFADETPQRAALRPGFRGGSQTEPRGSTTVRTPRPKSARATTSSRGRVDVLGLSLDGRLERPRSDDRPATNPEVAVEDSEDRLGLGPPHFDLFPQMTGIGSSSVNSIGGSGGPELVEAAARAAAAAGDGGSGSGGGGGGDGSNLSRGRMRRSPSFRTAGLQKHIETISAVTPDQPFKQGRGAASASPMRAESLDSRRRTKSMSGTLRGRALSLLSQVVELDTSCIPGPYSPPASPSQQSTKTSFEKALEAPIWVPFSESHGHITPPEAVAEPAAGAAAAAAAAVSPAAAETPAKLLKPPRASPTRLLSPGWLGEDESPAWVDTSRFEPFQSILSIMFVQTAESLASARFEVRRIAKMVMPLLTEVVHWYQPGLLDDIWSTCFPAGPATWPVTSMTHALRHC